MKKQQRIKRNNLIIKDYLDGMTYQNLYEKYNLSKIGVWKVLKKNNIILRGNVSDIQTKKIIEEYKSGVGVNELEEKYFCSQSAIYKRLKDNGFKLKKGGSKPKTMVSKKYLTGLATKNTKKEMMNILNISQLTLEKWLKFYQITKKRKNIIDEEFIKKYYKSYYNTDNSLAVFSYIIDYSVEFIRKKQRSLKLPSKSKTTTFKKYNNADVINKKRSDR